MSIQVLGAISMFAILFVVVGGIVWLESKTFERQRNEPT